MAKLIAVAITIATLLAFASAHGIIITTTTTTTIEDGINPSSKTQQQCSQHLQGQQFRQCQSYLQQPAEQKHQQTLQKCCNELRNVDQMCVCKAVKKMFGDVQQQQQQTGPFGSQPIQEVKEKAQNLPNICNVQTREQQCDIKSVQKCRQEIKGRQFNECRTYLEQQIRAGYLRPVEALECCEEHRNDVDVECQCEATKELYSQAAQEEQSRQHPRLEMVELRRIVESLKEQSNLEVEICRIPSIYNVLKD